ncbi:MAG: Crp/Fnr family transcriptional regulator [Bacteroidales bacterium]|jgi:CRP/FNR family transcriptional regulator|nr:Crp/Fnr family transcriptional regulator [Bacteroidales bacterium]MDI9575219.1 Crp/Fnr family transcriptional regulator [Bacteroidota bacterium]MDD3756371.1 Crp/Fnr family transcriptional regulator [Bacteroidales bacterium]MDY0401593.1 Crp/Fnr family transcriptional regulator [Bacteroidales bacterium]HHW59378.1 Crp/Fnr family transcriptional regulator [Bacteroidales bacterium]
MKNQEIGGKSIENKFLTFLYSLDDNFNKNKKIEEIFTYIINNLCVNFSYPDRCNVSIVYKDAYYGSNIDDVLDPDDILTFPLIINKKENGNINVYYEGSENEKLKFTNSERDFLKLIATRLSDFITISEIMENHGYKEYTPIYDAKIVEKHSLDLVNWLYSFNLTMDQIEKLLHTCLNFRKGETVCKQNAFSSYFLLLADGYCKSFVEDSKGHTLSFMVNKAFEFIALSSLYCKSFYFTTMTLTPCKIYLIEKNDFLEIMKYNQSFHTEVTKWLCDNYNIVFEKLAIRGLKQTIGRVAHTLLYLSQTVFENNEIPNIISRKDIAEFSGMSTENCVRILSSLKKDNIIKYTKKGIQIVDLDLLKTIVIAG